MCWIFLDHFFAFLMLPIFPNIIVFMRFLLGNWFKWWPQKVLQFLQNLLILRYSKPNIGFKHIKCFVCCQARLIFYIICSPLQIKSSELFYFLLVVLPIWPNFWPQWRDRWKIRMNISLQNNKPNAISIRKIIMVWYCPKRGSEILRFAVIFRDFPHVLDYVLHIFGG